MRVVTAAEMRDLDSRAIGEAGMPGVVLMENAGRAVASVLTRRFGGLVGTRVHVACGTGNNGGDGFVVARLLALGGARVAVSLAGDAERVRGEARVHLSLLHAAGAERVDVVGDADLYVDALLGTGSRGAPREPHASAIRRMNASGRPIVAVDIPSGVDADTGAIEGDAVDATVTVTFAFPKLGMFIAPGAARVGDLVVDHIGFAWTSLGADASAEWFQAEDAHALLVPRRRDAHKGDFGHVLICGGSDGMSGAPTMAARSALRAGAGLVTVAAPRTAQRVVAARLEEAMTMALPEERGALSAAAIEPLRRAAVRCDALCVGPGGSRQPGASDAMLGLLVGADIPAVVDADALNALAARPDALRGRKASTVLTPHPGECGRLLGTDAAGVQSDRVSAARRCAGRYGAVVVLKGSHTLVCDGRGPANRERTVSINTTGNPGMATAGSGDSLTGIVGAFLAGGMDAWDAARLGAHVHGRAGDLAASVLGERAMVAGDIIDQVSAALRDLEGQG
ncbi:MAG: NAD(P)H-hydrate dehydratase [Chthonomonadales bacterium]|nr:NAD(P)H-hydrate dehydratase [Chthonomonadales bacterium]